MINNILITFPMEEPTNRKSRSKISLEVLKSVRKSIKKEFTLKNIAEEAEISMTCARNLYVNINSGKTDEEILNVKKGRHCKDNSELKNKIRTFIDQEPDNTTRSIKEKLAAENNRTSIATISRILKSMDYTRKRLSIVPTERNATRTIDLRQEFCRYINNVSNENLVFLDETGFNLHQKKHYGYSLKNTKCFITMPGSRGRNMSLMLAIKQSGIVAKGIVEGAYNGDTFKSFITDELKQHFLTNPRDVLVMDNCSFHHRSDVTALLENFGITVLIYRLIHLN